MKKTIKYLGYSLLVFALFYTAILYKNPISKSVSFSIGYCLEILIPSLFPMIFIASFASFSPFKNVIAFAFKGFMTKVLKMPQSLASAFVFGLCSGYPVGAKLCSVLLEKGEISHKDARDFLCYAFNPGIPFCILFVGIGIFKSLKIGVFMFISCCLASFLIAVLIAIFFRRKVEFSQVTENKEQNFLEVFALSAKSSLSATVNMCLYIMIFSALIQVLHSTNIFQFAVKTLSQNPIFTPIETASLFSAFWEITSGVSTALSFNLSPEIFLIALSFGGLCLHFQLFALIPQNFKSLAMFYSARLFHMIFSVFCLKILLYFFPISSAVFSTSSATVVESFSFSAPNTISLIFLGICLVYCNFFVEKVKKI